MQHPMFLRRFRYLLKQIRYSSLINQAKFIKTISSNDLMYQTGPKYYFMWGASALDAVQAVLKKAGRRRIRTILDLPCGHGRELRFFKIAFPEAEITACDIDRDGVDYCVKNFKVKGAYSNPDPLLIPVSDQFDLIWCGSLFTHFDIENWRKLLTFFRERLEINGILIFSAHGPFIAEELRQGQLTLGLDQSNIEQILKSYATSGFGYTNYSGETDYGISLSSPTWISSFLQAWPDLKLISHRNKGWSNWDNSWGHDTLAIQRMR